MRIWIDLANSPHVPFFRALVAEFERRGARGRDDGARLRADRRAGRGRGPHADGHRRPRRARARGQGREPRRARVRRCAGGRAGASSTSPSATTPTRTSSRRALLALRSVTLMDYEHQPANHLAFRLASRVVVPRSFPDEALRRYGARPRKVRRYEGTKEDVYLADFDARPALRGDSGGARRRAGGRAHRRAAARARRALPPLRERAVRRAADETARARPA